MTKPSYPGTQSCGCVLTSSQSTSQCAWRRGSQTPHIGSWWLLGESAFFRCCPRFSGWPYTYAHAGSMNWVLWVERTLSWECVWLEVVWEEFKDLGSRYNQNTCKILKQSIKNVSGGKKAMERGSGRKERLRLIFLYSLVLVLSWGKNFSSKWGMFLTCYCTEELAAKWKSEGSWWEIT